MPILAKVLLAVVALLHVGFLVLEMFLWATPTGIKIFKSTKEQAEATKVLAKNQGLYNGFLAAGIAWSLSVDPGIGRPAALLFAIFVLVAGLYGGATASRTIFFVQALPAALAIGAMFLAV